MAALTWTAEAERWLRDIYDYIALDNPTAAARTVEAIYLKAELLRGFPNRATATGKNQTATSAFSFTDIIASPT